MHISILSFEFWQFELDLLLDWLYI